MTTTASAPSRPTTPAAPALRRRLRDERSLFLVCTALVAVHVADDNFLQPPAGTSAADHLAGGLVPMALLVAVAWGYGRVGAGWRGLLALVVGVFGVGIGALEAGYYTIAVGPSGDDFTGLLAIPAGLLLVGLGSVTLWRSRRRDGPMLRRVIRRALPVAIGILAAFFVAHRNVSFRTSDGLRLHGWYIRSRNGAAVVDFPGHLGTQAHARMRAQHGYGVLLFDRRGEGRSEGAGNMLGWGGDRDIIAAVDWAAS